jgi:integrase
MKTIRIHDMRHTYASLLANSGRSILEISRILGHSTVKISERYSHLSTATLQDAANSASIIINKAMGGTTT